MYTINKKNNKKRYMTPVLFNMNLNYMAKTSITDRLLKGKKERNSIEGIEKS